MPSSGTTRTSSCMPAATTADAWSAPEPTPGPAGHLDDYAAHMHPKVRAWLDRHKRFVFHFTPTSCSWLNAVEGFFAKRAKRRLKRGVFHFLIDLRAAIIPLRLGAVAVADNIGFLIRRSEVRILSGSPILSIGYPIAVPLDIIHGCCRQTRYNQDTGR